MIKHLFKQLSSIINKIKMKGKQGRHKQYKLKRELGLFEISLYGIGIILGAGIYALIGEGAGIAGNALWISFIIAAIIASFTGLSYAELSSMFPKEAAEYNYTKNAFRRRYLSFIVGWVMIFAGVISGTAVALGFAGYFSFIFGVDKILVAALLIMSISFINYIGIKESAKFNIVSTLIESGGLVIIILIGAFVFFTAGFGDVNFLEMPADIGIPGILSATALIFFAYIGFEDIVNISEETKKAKKLVPKALVISLAVSTILYILVAVSAVGVVGWEKLASSHAPLSEVAVGIFPASGIIFSIIALFSTANTALILFIVASRIFYGMAADKAMPSVLGRIGVRGTPYNAIVIVMFLGLLVLMLGNLKTIALLTDVGIFIIYTLINLSLITLRYRMPHLKRGFRTPLNIGKFPVLALLGVLTSLFMLLYFDIQIILYEVGIIFAGYLFYMAFVRKNQGKWVKNKRRVSGRVSRGKANTRARK